MYVCMCIYIYIYIYIEIYASIGWCEDARRKQAEHSIARRTYASAMGTWHAQDMTLSRMHTEGVRCYFQY